MERPKALYLHKIPGLMPDCNEHLYHYKYRNQWADMDETKKFYQDYPPEVGQTVVILRTFAQQMLKPDVRQIEALNKSGNIVVEHAHMDYAGKLFLKNGQNWKAKRSQTWLVPAELYRDIPKKKPADTDFSAYVGYPEEDGLDIGEMQEIMGISRFKDALDKLMADGKTYKKAKQIIELELLNEQWGSGRGFIRAATRAQNRFGKRLY